MWGAPLHALPCHVDLNHVRGEEGAHERLVLFWNLDPLLLRGPQLTRNLTLNDGIRRKEPYLGGGERVGAVLGGVRGGLGGARWG